VLIGGDPGIGKSTLLLQVATILSVADVPVLYVTGEESLTQLKMRAERLETPSPEMYVLIRDQPGRDLQAMPANPARRARHRFHSDHL